MSCERSFGVPAIHHDELEVPGEARHHDRNTARHVEERHDQDETRGETASLLAGPRRAACTAAPAEKAMTLWQIAPCVDTAPLGKAGRARGVEDRRVGVGVDLDLGASRRP